VVRVQVTALEPAHLGTFRGIVERDNHCNGGSGSTLQITIGINGMCSGTLTDALGVARFTGGFDRLPGGGLEANISLPNHPAQLLELTLAPNVPEVRGRAVPVGVGVSGYPLVTAFKDRSRDGFLTTRAGRYLLSHRAASTQNDVPKGAGYSIITVTSKGQATWVVHMPDGLVGTSTGWINGADQVLLHTLMAAGSRSALGQVTLSDSPLAANVDWLATGGPSRLEITSFPLHQLQVVGRKHTPPEIGESYFPPSLTAPVQTQFEVSAGGLLGTHANRLTISPNAKVTWVNRPLAGHVNSLIFDRNTGLILGKIQGKTPGMTWPEVKFSGVALRDEGIVAGFFLRPNPAPGQSSVSAKLSSGLVELKSVSP